MPSSNQTDYTSRDYSSIRNDLIRQISTRLPEWTSRDPSDFGIVLLEQFATVGDGINYSLDRVANEFLLETATRRESVASIARMLDYKPTDLLPARVKLQFSNATDSPITIPAGTQAAAVAVNSAGESVQVVFETDSAVTCQGTSYDVSSKSLVGTTATLTTTYPHPYLVGTVVTVANVGSPFDGTFTLTAVTGTTFSYTTSSGTVAATACSGKATSIPTYAGVVEVLAIQGVTHQESLGTSTGAAHQEFPLYYPGVIEGSIKVVCNNIEYRYVEHILDCGSEDPSFTTFTTLDEITWVTFGDGLHARIPPGGARIDATYRTGKGALGNVPPNSIDTLVDSMSLSVTNPIRALNGSDRESIDSIRRNAPKSFYAVNRAVTLNDYALLSLRVPGVAKASSAASVYSNVNLYVAPTSGYDGIPLNDTLKATVEQYLSDKIPVGASVSVLSPNIYDLWMSINVITQPRFKRSIVATNVLNTLLSMFSFQAVELEDPISLMSVMAALDRVPGVLSCEFNTFNKLNIPGVSNRLMFAAGDLPRLLEANITITPNPDYGLPD